MLRGGGHEEVEGPTMNKTAMPLAVALVATAVVTTLPSAAAETIVDCLDVLPAIVFTPTDRL
jgi:hypothetical protein